MSKRTEIVKTLMQHIEDSTSSTGFRGYRFLQEINSFPSFYLAFQNERRIHRGAGVRYGLISISLRGYCWSDSLDDVELYMRSLEIAVQSFKSILVDEARITSAKTDEGIMQPYGVVDLSLELLYTLEQ